MMRTGTGHTHDYRGTHRTRGACRSRESPVTALDVGAFEFEQAVIEIRYKEAFSFWDNAGALWERVLAQYPAAVLKVGSPGVTTFHLDKELELTAELARAVVVHHRPPADLKRLAWTKPSRSDRKST